MTVCILIEMRKAYANTNTSSALTNLNLRLISPLIHTIRAITNPTGVMSFMASTETEEGLVIPPVCSQLARSQHKATKPHRQ